MCLLRSPLRPTPRSSHRENRTSPYEDPAPARVPRDHPLWQADRRLRRLHRRRRSGFRIDILPLGLILAGPDRGQGNLKSSQPELRLCRTAAVIAVTRSPACEHRTVERFDVTPEQANADVLAELGFSVRTSDSPYEDLPWRGQWEGTLLGSRPDGSHANAVRFSPVRHRDHR